MPAFGVQDLVFDHHMDRSLADTVHSLVHVANKVRAHVHRLGSDHVRRMSDRHLFDPAFLAGMSDTRLPPVPDESLVPVCISD